MTLYYHCKGNSPRVRISFPKNVPAIVNMVYGTLERPCWTIHILATAASYILFESGPSEPRARVEGHFNPGLFDPKLQPQTFQP